MNGLFRWIATGSIGTIALTAFIPSSGAAAEPIAVLKGHQGTVESLAFSSDGKRLFSCGGLRMGKGPLEGDGTARLWDLVMGRAKVMLKRQEYRLLDAMALSPDESTLAVGCPFQAVELWDLKSGKRKRTFPVEELVESIAYSPDGKTLATGGRNARILLWATQPAADR